MYKFYKTTNEIFKSFFLLLFVVGILGLAYGFLYLIYTFFTDSFTIFDTKNNLFIFEYMLVCVVSITSGVTGADLNLKE